MRNISYEIIVDENLEIIILRQNEEKNIIKSENKILFSDAKRVKFEFSEITNKEIGIDYSNRDISRLGSPVLEMISGSHIAMLDAVDIDEFSAIADKINLVLKEYRAKALAESSRVKSKSQNISVKDL